MCKRRKEWRRAKKERQRYEAAKNQRKKKKGVNSTVDRQAGTVCQDLQKPGSQPVAGLRRDLTRSSRYLLTALISFINRGGANSVPPRRKYRGWKDRVRSEARLEIQGMQVNVDGVELWMGLGTEWMATEFRASFFAVGLFFMFFFFFFFFFFLKK